MRKIRISESKLVKLIRRTIKEGQDYHGSHAGGDGAASSNAQAMGEHTLPAPNQNHTHSSCVASDCFMDMSFSNGTQYGGTVSLEGCGVGTYTIYVNNQFAGSGTANGAQINFSMTVNYNGTSPIIKIKSTLECGSHPSAQEQTITKYICVQRSTGNIISCNKKIPNNKVPLSKTELKVETRDMRVRRVN